MAEERPVSRREFLKLAGMAGATIGVGAGFGALLAACGESTTTTTAAAATSVPGATTTAAGATTSTASGSTPTSSAAAKEDIESLKLVWSIQTPTLSNTAGSLAPAGILLMGMEPLLRYDSPTSIFNPCVAESYKQVDPLTYTFQIRQGVKFWDGSPLTAEDAAFSLNLNMDPESMNSYFFVDVESVAATSASEVTVKLKAPNPDFLFTAAFVGICSKAYYTANQDQIGSPSVLNMGSGPYKFVSFRPSAETVLERNEDYWGEKPPVKKLDFITIGDDSARLMALRSGDADGIFGVPQTQVNSLEGIDDLELTSVTDFSVYKFNFDTGKAPWDDVHLRTAFAHVVNPEAINAAVFAGNAVPAFTAVPPAIFKPWVTDDVLQAGYDAIAAVTPKFDIEAAKKEMALSSVPDGLKVSVLVTGSDPALSLICQTVAQDARQIGIELEIQQVDDETYYNATYFKHTTEGLTIDNSGAPHPDPTGLVDAILNSANALPQGSGVNVAQYINPEVDKMLSDNKALAVDDPQRMNLVFDALTLAAQDVPYAYIVYPNVTMGMRKGLSYSDFTAFYWADAWPYKISRTD